MPLGLDKGHLAISLVEVLFALAGLFLTGGGQGGNTWGSRRVPRRLTQAGLYVAYASPQRCKHPSAGQKRGAKNIHGSMARHPAVLKRVPAGERPACCPMHRAYSAVALLQFHTACPDQYMISVIVLCAAPDHNVRSFLADSGFWQDVRRWTPKAPPRVPSEQGQQHISTAGSSRGAVPAARAARRFRPLPSVHSSCRSLRWHRAAEQWG